MRCCRETGKKGRRKSRCSDIPFGEKTEQGEVDRGGTNQPLRYDILRRWRWGDLSRNRRREERRLVSNITGVKVEERSREPGMQKHEWGGKGASDDRSTLTPIAWGDQPLAEGFPKPDGGPHRNHCRSEEKKVHHLTLQRTNLGSSAPSREKT